jgi:serine/threonine-protein kinase
VIVPSLAPGDLFAGHFRVVRVLDEGGVSTLHVIEHVDTGQRRLLQRVPADEITAMRVHKETQLWSRLAGEHGTVLLDSGHDGGVAWLAWELVDGDALAERIHRAGPLGPEEARLVIGQLGDALAKLHAQGVVQRDLRPEAVLIERATARVRLAGYVCVDRLVRGASAELFGSAVDELSWVAPEQVTTQGHLTQTTDVWSFALVAFYALTGLRYWQGTSAVELAREILMDPLPPASARAAELGFTQPLPSGFDAWFAACLNRDPNARLSDMNAVTRAFGALFSRASDPRDISPGNPAPPHYDDGVQDPPPSQPGGYRGGVHGRNDVRRDDIILANPKGSFYDRGLIRNPRRWPFVLVVLGLVLGAVWAVLSRRH